VNRINDTIGRWIRRVLGVFFLIVGIAGLFLPILQGILLLIIGILLLAGESIWVRRKIVSLKTRYPESYAIFRRWRKKFRRKKRNP
jgi:hypothetical protein